MRRVLIADPSVKDEVYIKEKLKDVFEVAFCSDGREFYSMMSQFDPDLLLLDLRLPNAEGLTLLRDIRAVGNMIPIIVTSAYLQDYIMAALANLQVCAVLQSPWKIDKILDAICQFGETQQLDDQRPIDVELDYILIRLGYKVGSKRYQYARQAVLERYACENISMTKELYPMLEKIISGGGGCAEKAIRDGVRYAMGVGDRELWQSFFPALKKNELPKNEEFISRIAIALRHRERPRKGNCGFLEKVAGL